jgi:alkanesulfonate monooxygenase SsuD/methylene tetrahydromethanopterin reductase-like flavin-dependent oxidoreductase (luciferase family)
VDLGVHLPLMQFDGEPLSMRRLATTVDAARECGYAAVAANDHLVFRTPWLDGPTALASAIERSGEMALATTVALPVVRGPVALAKALAAIDLLAEGRLIAALGPGSSERDYEVAGVPFAERWQRFDESVAVLRALLRGEPMPERPRHYPLPPGLVLAPGRRVRAAFRSGSGAGARRPGSPGSPGRATAGSPLPTTRRRSASAPPARRSRGRSRSAGAIRSASPTPSPRCGPG